MSKKNILIILTGGIFIVIFITTRLTGKKECNLSEEQTMEQIKAEYERELFADIKLQEKVRNFSLPVNILSLFHEHEEQFNSFAEQCYKNRGESDFFFVEYIDNRRFYFCLKDIRGKESLEENDAIRDGVYDHNTSFMDYMIDNRIVFRDWMLEIQTPDRADEGEYKEKRDGNYGPILTITVYEGTRLNISFLYSPYKEIDYSEEYFAPGACTYSGYVKTTRINANWYYSYGTTELIDYWRPELKELGFSEEFYSGRRTTAVMRHILTENLRGFLRLYWKYGLDYKEISWWDLEDLRWTEWYMPEPEYEIPVGDAKP